MGRFQMNNVEVVRQVRGLKLSSTSELFELGALADSPTDESFVRRLNTAMARLRTDTERRIPATFADAIKKDGELKKHAELVAVGHWLLLDGHPGMPRTRGKQADPRTVLKCVAVIMATIATRARQRAKKMEIQARTSRQREITKHDLVGGWKRLFGEIVNASMFDAKLRTIQRVLPFYLEHLKSGGANHAGVRIKKSPEVKRVLDAIFGMLPASHTDTPDILTEPNVKRPARLVPFEIELEYQSDAHEALYRNLSTGAHPAARLRYVPKRTTPTSPSGNMRADRVGKIVLEPEVHIRRDYRTEALIDRLVILVETRAKIDDFRLQMAITSKTAATTYVHDLRHWKGPGPGWGTPLMDVDRSKLTGAPFAIMIQEPTADGLTAILDAIRNGPGIVGPVLLHLIEVSVDFYPKNAGTPEETVLGRERMVGLLQRHHWTRPSLLLEPGFNAPRHIDARQLHEKEIEHGEIVSAVRYLFAHEKSSGGIYRSETDAMTSDPEIRSRILTAKPGFPLALNGTTVKGGKFAPHHVSVQNKISDKRNPDKNTIVSLPDDARRARVEVVISGTETLKKHGLGTIDDLGNISFRKLTRDFLSFRLGMVEPWQHLLEDAKAQMRTRGVYGIDLRLRALDLERRKSMKQAGGKLPRKTEREGMGLDDWLEMNDVIGRAIDELKRRWSGFTTT